MAERNNFWLMMLSSSCKKCECFWQRLTPNDWSACRRRAGASISGHHANYRARIFAFPNLYLERVIRSNFKPRNVYFHTNYTWISVIRTFHCQCICVFIGIVKQFCCSVYCRANQGCWQDTSTIVPRLNSP